ncbi:TolB family protein [Micromonospora sp. bgisy143]|uniref:TolB family protein n=1 Tax=Micromonospora sp. bgisy143 TaxID=3413790 RepID=UPI003EBF735B
MRKMQICLVLGLTAAMSVGVSAVPAAADGETTTLVSASTGGAQTNTFSGDSAVSADGRYVVFWSEASNLVPGDTNGVGDVFVRERVTGLITRVSVSTGGTQGNRISNEPAISADGRYVAFSSAASNLVTGDLNGMVDIFLRDRVAGTTSLVSVSSTGSAALSPSNGPAISADGRYVAFISSAYLVPGDTNGFSDVFVRDRVTGLTSRVSVSSTGAGANEGSFSASISADGRHVVFASGASNLVADDTNGTPDVFLHDRATGLTSRVSVSSTGAEANDGSGSLAISGDGRYIAFTSGASNLVPGDTNQVTDVFLRDRLIATTTRVSVSTSGGQAESHSPSLKAAISADGRFIAFMSYASNLVPPDVNREYDVFLRDRVAGTTRRVSLATNGTEPNGRSYTGKGISADGRYVTFDSIASNLAPGDTDGAYDVFLRDLGAPTTPVDPPQPPVIPTLPAPPQPAPASAPPPT